jgi:hypothetical protein
MGYDLSLKDIRFLRAVRDINANPEAYERTEKGEVPASTGAIIAASELSESEARYRMGGSRCRGFEEMGLTLVHEAEFDEETKTFGAKSIELTQEGIDVLTEFEEENDLYDDQDGEDGDVPEVVKQLRGRVEKLEKRSVSGGSDGGDFSREIKSLRNDIERIETKIDGIREDPWGGLDDDAVELTKAGVDRANALFYILETVFGIDVERRTEEGSYPSEDAIEVERVELAERLLSAEYPDERESASPTEEPVAQPADEPSQTEHGTPGGGANQPESANAEERGDPDRV